MVLGLGCSLHDPISSGSCGLRLPRQWLASVGTRVVGGVRFYGLRVGGSK